MWEPWAQSRCGCGRGEPSPGADVGLVRPVPVQLWEGEPSPDCKCDTCDVRVVSTASHAFAMGRLHGAPPWGNEAGRAHGSPHGKLSTGESELRGVPQAEIARLPVFGPLEMPHGRSGVYEVKAVPHRGRVPRPASRSARPSLVSFGALTAFAELAR